MYTCFAHANTRHLSLLIHNDCFLLRNRKKAMFQTLLLLAVVNFGTALVHFEIDPPTGILIKEHEIRCIDVNITSLQSDNLDNITVTDVMSTHPSVAMVTNYSQPELSSTTTLTVTYHFQVCVEGKFLGRTHLAMAAEKYEDQGTVVRKQFPRFYEVAVEKADSNPAVQLTMNILVSVMALVSIFRNSLLIKFAEMKKIMLHPVGPLICIIVQFFLMPLVSYLFIFESCVNNRGSLSL